MIRAREQKTEGISLLKFPPSIRCSLRVDERNRMFLRAEKEIKTIMGKCNLSQITPNSPYCRRKYRILQLLSASPQSAKELIERSGLSSTTVYDFLCSLRKKGAISKKGRNFCLNESNLIPLDEIVKMEDCPELRRRFGVSFGELEIAYFLWNSSIDVFGEEQYSTRHQKMHQLAEAVHRWKNGRTDIPVWALKKLIDISEFDVSNKEGSILRYHFPPGTSIEPYYEDEYKIPVKVGIDLDRIVVQLLLRMSNNWIYTFPKEKVWLFEKLHQSFGEFDDSKSRIPPAIAMILKSYYEITAVNRSRARVPECMKTRWSQLDQLDRVIEESSLLLHVISLSSRSDDGFEVTSRSRLFLEDLSDLLSDLRLGAPGVYRKRNRPHFRMYVSEKKVEMLRKYAFLYSRCPGLKNWLRIPLNQIEEELLFTKEDSVSPESICRKELSNFVESILMSLDRRRSSECSRGGMNLLEYKALITDYFWQQDLIPSIERVEKLLEDLLLHEVS